MENKKPQILTEDQLIKYIDEIEKLPKMISITGINYVVVNSEADRLEELKKNVLAEIKNEYSKNIQGKISESLLERLAYAHERYKQHINEMCTARKQANLARVEYEKQLKTFDMLRSLISLEKAKMGL